MDTEIREWIIMIWEYCQEHWAAAIAAAVVLLILVISFFLVCTAKREDAKAKAQVEELSAPEHEPKPAVEPASDAAEAESSDEAEVQTEPVDPLVADAESETTAAEPAVEPALTTDEPSAEPSAKTAATVPTDEPQQQAAAEQKTMQAALTDAVMKQLMREVEEVSAASGQKVDSIELNIEKARLTIRYAEGAAEESDGTKPQPKCTLELQDSDVSAAGEHNSDAKGSTNRAADGAGGGEGQIEESVMPRKFGMENMNRAKSGRVYTEDELLSQIKD